MPALVIGRPKRDNEARMLFASSSCHGKLVDGMNSLTRRRFLELTTLSGGTIALGALGLQAVSTALVKGSPLFAAIYFQGGWDQLLTLDPRDNTLPEYQRDAASAHDGTGIWPAYDMVADARVREVLTRTQGKGIQTAGGIDFGPAIPPSLLDLADELCVVRGIDMATLTHEVGMRYFLTGQFPRGASPKGSSLGTIVAAARGQGARLPHLAIETEAYNTALPASASPLAMENAALTLNLLQPPRDTRQRDAPRSPAELAALALSLGISHAVSFRAAAELDDHDDWGNTHATKLWDGFDTVARFIKRLKETPYLNTNTSTWEHTTLIVFSDFSRTPNLNERDGRDHHLASSCLVAGPGLAKGKVVGGTSNKKMAVMPANFATGEIDPKGGQIRPSDICATLLRSMGISPEPLSSEAPTILDAMLIAASRRC